MWYPWLITGGNSGDTIPITFLKYGEASPEYMPGLVLRDIKRYELICMGVIILTGLRIGVPHAGTEKRGNL